MRTFSFFRKMGFFFKNGLMVSILLISGIGVITVVSIREQTKTIKVELIEKNKYISRHLASSTKSAFWSLNWLFVEKQMQEVTRSEDVIFLEIVKPNGEVYLTAGDKEYMEKFSSFQLMSPEEQIVKDLICSKTGKITNLLITPIEIGDERWSIIMVFSLKRIDEAKKAILKNSIRYGSIIFLSGILICFWFSKGMARRIKYLKEGTEEIAKGNLDYRIRIESLDEIGYLARSFNQMTEDLKKTTASRDQLAAEISERKEAEKALKISEEKHRTILESIDDGYYELDLSGNFTFFNNSTCRVLGYHKDELMGMNYRRYMDQETAKKVYQIFNKIYTTEKPSKVFDYEITCKDGSKRYIDVSASPKKDSKGQIIGFRGVSRDITERKHAEEALRKSEERYRTILDEIDEGYFEVDLKGNFISFNDRLSIGLGYSPYELMGMNNRDYMTPESAKKAYEIFTELFQTGKPVKKCGE